MPQETKTRRRVVRGIPLLDRFYLQVDIPSDPSLCWEWTGAKGGMGYGQFWGTTKTIKAHRFAYEHFNSPIPAGLVVRHTCDNPGCVNPKHLLVGSTQDNVDDKISRNRHVVSPGERNGMAKLTESDVIAILEGLKNGETQRSLADKFGVSRTVVTRIRNGTRWGHLQDEETKAGVPKLRRIMNEEEVAQVQAYLAAGMIQQEIADMFGVGRWQISRIKNGIHLTLLKAA